MLEYYRRERIKSAIIIVFILGFAAIATYKIYYDFKDKRKLDYNTDTLDVTFHEKSGDRVSITRVTPVRDSVGLSSKAYTFTIKNNLSKPINYSIKIVDDYDKILEDECGDSLIPHSIIKVSIHKNKTSNKIYLLSDLEEGNIVTGTIDANSEEVYTMRFWISDNSTVTSGSDLHYHGIIKVLRNDNTVATAIN